MNNPNYFIPTAVGAAVSLGEILLNASSVERDALDPEDGVVIWNTDTQEIQAFTGTNWETVVLEPVMEALFETLAYRIARMETALRFLDINVEQFEPL